jgi:nitrate/TMAO reductase-like tetraheme cytochrome c subunit
MEGRQGKMLTPGMKIAIGTIVTIIFVGLIVFVVMRNQGMIPGM